MFFDSSELYIKQTVRQEFDRNHRSGVLHQIWSKIMGRSCNLLDIRQIESTLQNRGQSYSGLRSVPIGRILGSEGKSSDFDINWRPLKTLSKHRWTNIALASEKGVGMPAVDLLKIGDIYFVRDGHHRISVAKFQGQLEIEANVLSWRSENFSIKSNNVSVQARRSVRSAPIIRSLLQVAHAIRRRIGSAIEELGLGSISRISTTEA